MSVREIAERFWSKVKPDPSTGCLLWMAGGDQKGYGTFWVAKRRPMKAHRFSYELVHGAIPEGMQIDHLCRVRSCVNPKHLRVVTNRENLLEPRSQSLPRLCLNREACVNGHLYTVENTWMDGRTRRCRTCLNKRHAEYRQRHSAVVKEKQRLRRSQPAARAKHIAYCRDWRRRAALDAREREQGGERE